MHHVDKSNITDKYYTEALLQLVYHFEDLVESNETPAAWPQNTMPNMSLLSKIQACFLKQRYPGLYSTKKKKNPDTADPLVVQMSVCLEMNISGWAVIRLDVVQGLCRLLLPAVASPIFTQQTCTYPHSQGCSFLENSKQMCKGNNIIITNDWVCMCCFDQLQILTS